MTMLMTMMRMMIIVLGKIIDNDNVDDDDNDEDGHLASSVKSLTESPLPEESEYFLPGGGQHRILKKVHDYDDNNDYDNNDDNNDELGVDSIAVPLFTNSQSETRTQRTLIVR